jgi:tetratricopeptide (TPR) repeat protein
MGIEIKRCSVPVHHYGKVKGEDIASKGEAYYQMGKRKLEETGDDIDAIRELAVQAEILGKPGEAIELWKKLIALKPDTPIAFVNMATVYLKLENYEEACKAAKCAVDLAPYMKEALNNYALCELYLGNIKRSISVFEKILRQEPEYMSSQFLLAVAYCCDERKPEGLKILKKLLPTASGPGLAAACHTFAKKLVSAQRLEYAISLLGAAIEGKYVNEDILSLLDECRRIKDESMNHIDSTAALPAKFKDMQPYTSSASIH